MISLHREPTVEEMAAELGVPREDVVFALEAIQDPVSLFEPVYNDGGDAIYIMDQVKDTKHQDDNWLEHIAIKEAMRRLNEREKKSCACASTRAGRRWRWPGKSASPRPRCPGWKRTRWCTCANMWR